MTSRSFALAAVLFLGTVGGPVTALAQTQPEVNRYEVMLQVTRDRAAALLLATMQAEMMRNVFQTVKSRAKAPTGSNALGVAKPAIEAPRPAT